MRKHALVGGLLLLGIVGTAYVRAQDPFIFTSYKGWDPEAGFSVGNPNSGASQIDQGGPAFRSVLFGVDVRF